MIRCGTCGATNASGLQVCARCAGALDPLAVTPGEEEEALRSLREGERLKDRRKAHACTGAITFLLLNLLVGLPSSLLPWNLVLNALTSMVFGLPVGWLISRLGGGPWRGAFISMATFIAARIVLGLPSLLGSGTMGGVLFAAAIWGLGGVIPGLIIGYHVKDDA